MKCRIHRIPINSRDPHQYIEDQDHHCCYPQELQGHDQSLDAHLFLFLSARLGIYIFQHFLLDCIYLHILSFVLFLSFLRLIPRVLYYNPFPRLTQQKRTAGPFPCPDVRKKGSQSFFRFFLNFGYIKKKAGMKNICFFYKYLFLIFGYL